MKVYIHIYNYNTSYNDNVFVIVDMPFIPVKGNHIYLSEYDEIMLEEKARKDLISYSNYLYNKSYKFRDCNDIDKADPEDLSFSGCIVVYNVMYNTEDSTIHIELYDGNKPKYE